MKFIKLPVLFLAAMELFFLVIAATVLCFGFTIGIILITH